MREWRDIVRAIFRLGSLALIAFPFAATLAQTSDFKIVWINIGEVAAERDGRTARAGRQLFMAPDLVKFSLDKVTVAKVDVEPTVIALKIGERFCLTSLRVAANDEDRAEVDNAPLSVSVRQDQRERLSMKRAKNDICFAPSSPGEYPVRFNSLLPARDGTTRGAQIFLRVQGENVDDDVPIAAPAVSASESAAIRNRGA
jgi:hypothetical protein